MSTNSESQKFDNFQPHEILEVTSDCRVPDPIGITPSELVRAGSQFEFIRYVGREWSELVYEKQSGMIVKIPTVNLTRPRKS